MESSLPGAVTLGGSQNQKTTVHTLIVLWEPFISPGLQGFIHHVYITVMSTIVELTMLDISWLCGLNKVTHVMVLNTPQMVVVHFLSLSEHKANRIRIS